jgi:autoinducer 2-degrading protein
MHIVQVYIHVKAEYVDGFKEATLENARLSRQEAGIARFDVLQQADDPSRFLLTEVYRTPQDPARHKETTHYNRWRVAVEPMLAEERTRTAYSNLFPDDSGW